MRPRASAARRSVRHIGAGEAASASDARVLVAEDDRWLRNVLVDGLEQAGYAVDAVTSGNEAIDQLRFTKYAVAVIDWQMPQVSGLAVVSWARRNKRPTAMLMISARDTPRDRVIGLDAGADDYLTKPFDFGELVARTRALQRCARNVAGVRTTSAARCDSKPT
jgi:DNA-binding response OmpR family regulator